MMRLSSWSLVRISDSGATSPCIGEKTWGTSLPIVLARTSHKAPQYEKCSRRFCFGNGEVLEARRKVIFEAKVLGKDRTFICSSLQVRLLAW